ncbi:recombinase family protein (plasmid) [Aneurinibacillus sp. Ricciae_BoGa-3]|uniref:recombinase family protein n=1 Tax=Aneurinibacillus sp. Ricciae_BoGa-3 TaxID=3022697 RepID=UPI0023405AF1|nr:recombinase family protein [Aneurinibacillus sp. Ricciae_BoGa-3]WCK57431.1 recombinase family protein [Aneurinibacillus sp. Ricciae_BoGa-3]
MPNMIGLEKGYLIKDVAIYLRKSRGDVDLDLDNHRLALTEICEAYGYRYKEFAEIGTSNSVDDRPIFLEMLEEIQQGLYDAVAVVEIERLGRGNDEDWGKIERILRDNEVLIITPEKVFDLENDEDEFQLDIKKFLARVEYKQISKRLRRGKILGAKRGEWTNGKPPFPYFYNRDKHSIEVDESKREIYNLIKGRALNGYTAEQIAWELNKLGHQSPGGKSWTSTAVYRLLYDQTHLGKIVFAKQKGSGHKNKKTKALKVFPQDEWIVIDGKHEAIKTLEEHNRILELFAKRRVIPRASRRGAFTLSGLVYCAKCGHSMQFTYNGQNDIEYVKKCQKSDELGNRCGNPGTNVNEIIKTVFQEINKIEDKRLNEKYDVLESELIVLRSSIKDKYDAITKHEEAINILQEQREDGEISKERFLERKRIREEQIQALQNEIVELEKRCEKRPEVKSLQEAYSEFENLNDNKSKNIFLKSIINKIYYTKDDDGMITVNINFR